MMIRERSEVYCWRRFKELNKFIVITVVEDRYIKIIIIIKFKQNVCLNNLNNVMRQLHSSRLCSALTLLCKGFQINCESG